MVATTAELLARGGYGRASFGDVIERSGAPRGSIYHHFPGGKDELVLAALELAGARAIDALGGADDDTPSTVTARFLDLWRRLLVHTAFGVGCSVLGLTVSADSPDLLARAGEVFRSWRGALADRLELAGLSRSDAAAFAVLLIAATEGAVVLSRAQHDLEPLDAVAAQLQAHVEALG
jgi:AcrR family transcriptional regulator